MDDTTRHRINILSHLSHAGTVVDHFRLREHVTDVILSRNGFTLQFIFVRDYLVTLVVTTVFYYCRHRRLLYVLDLQVNCHVYIQLIPYTAVSLLVKHNCISYNLIDVVRHSSKWIEVKHLKIWAIFTQIHYIHVYYIHKFYIEAFCCQYEKNTTV